VAYAHGIHSQHELWMKQMDGHSTCYLQGGATAAAAWSCLAAAATAAAAVVLS
jgi:hypothetical protein